MIRIASVALVAVAFAAPAMAQSSDDATVPIGGTVAQVCSLGAPSQAAIALGQLIDTSGVRVGRLSTIPTQTVSLPNSFCNFAGSSVSVSATAVISTDGAAVQPGFARAVNYDASVSGWAGAPTTVSTTATAGGGTPTTAASGGVQATPRLDDLTVDLSGFNVPGDALLVSGDYAGQITITLGPVTP